ncbi:MAG: DNA replication/repair protein RecF [Candidatus Acetothermia bacterium]
MKVQEVKLRNFRNLADQRINLDPSLNLLFGPNGSGKTNLCEAIAFVSTGDNLKGNRQGELIKWDSSFALVQLMTSKEDRIVVYLKKGDGKEVKVNSKTKRQSDLNNLIPVHTFVPEDLYISKGSPRRRRETLNYQISTLDHDYKKSLSDYRAELKKKNTLLKKEEINEEFLEVLGQRLVELGAKLVVKRKGYLEKLNDLLPEYYRKFVSGGGKLSLDYGEDLPAEVTEKNVRELLEERMESHREKELERGTSVVGPHRDKFRYRLDGRDLRKYGSQGELRTAVISTYLAYLDLYEAEFEDWPILILDDILSELDRDRGESFLENLPEEPQVIMTTATRNPAFTKLSGDFSVFEVEEGRVEVR